MLALQLFKEFFKVGAFTFGGGYAMISIVKTTLVDKHKWIAEKEFWDSIAIAQALPGVFAINMALYTGYKINGKLGAASAILGAVCPSLIIIMLIASFFQNINEFQTVKDIFSGIRPCVIALILAPGLTMLKKAVPTKYTFIFPLAACVLVCLGVSPIYIIIFAILFGIFAAKQVIKKAQTIEYQEEKEETK